MGRISAQAAVSVAATVALGGLGLAAPAALVTGTAGAAPTPSDQCTGLTGTATANQPFALSGCSSEGGEKNGKGTLSGTSATTATIKWTAPFESGKTLKLLNKAEKIVHTDEPERQGCPTGDNEALVTATVAPGFEDAGAKVSAEVCANTMTGAVVEEPGSPLTIG
jgi:hypothetical protein